MLESIQRNCKSCDKIMDLKTKRNGDIIKIHKNKKFCSTDCQNKWQKNVSWEERVGKDAADKIRLQRSLAVSGDNNPSKRSDISEKISNSLKKHFKDNPRSGEKNPFFGKKHTEEFKSKASESKQGKWSYTEEGYKKLLEKTPRGENHPNWNNGSSFLPYSPDFTKKLKKEIKERDKYECKICSKKTQKLAIHHIDYDKENCCKNNLISLCVSCHSKTNFNRELWISFFKNLIN